MTDLASNPFLPASPPTTSSATPAAERPKRGPRKAKEVVEKPARKARVAKAIAPTKPGRKPRAAKTAPASAGKLSINEIVSATVGLKEDEAKVLLSIVRELTAVKKSSKPKVLAALDKLFG